MTEDRIEIRRGTVTDAPACARIVDAWIGETAWKMRDVTLEQLEGYIADAMPEREVWVAGDPVCGYLSLDPDSQRIGGLYVATPGEGIGRALMEQAKKGHEYLWLHTHAPNLKAQHFYRREGFKEVSREPAATEGDPEEIRMEWRL